MSKPHFLAITYPAWAHTRSLIGLTANLLRVNPELHITILVEATRAAAAQAEFAQFAPDPERLLVVHYGEPVEGNHPMINPPGAGTFLKTVPQALNPFLEPICGGAEGIQDPIKGLVKLHRDPITAVIVDLTLGFTVPIIKGCFDRRAPDERRPPVIAHGAFNTAFIAWVYSDRVSPLGAKAKAIVEKGSSDSEKKKRLYEELIGSNTDIVNIPGLTPHYMYESDPIKHAAGGSSTVLIDLYYNLSKNGSVWKDGYVIGWPAGWGRELQAPLEEKFDHVWQMGPQLPAFGQDEWTVETKKGECKLFLDKMLAEAGPKSVVYASFGSAVYSPTLKTLSILLSVFESLGIRFIMATGKCPPDIKEMLDARIMRAGDRGLLIPWAPQKAILSHPATSFFLTHGGSNSAMESILLKVPMVVWPGGFDQPLVANELVKLGVARELIQIREGPNIGRKTWRDVLVHGTDDAVREEMLEIFGSLDKDAGLKLRGEVEKLSDVLWAECRPGGASYEAIVDLSRLH